MRQYAASAYPGIVDMRFGVEVTGISQGKDGVQALLAAKSGDASAAALQDVIQGSFLVDATGRNLLKADKMVYPERNYWVGGRFSGVGGGGDTTTRRSSAVITADKGSTIVLPNPDRTMIWTTSDVDTSTIGPEGQKQLLEARAAAMGVKSGMVAGAQPMPVAMQLTESLEPARGRVYAVGDSLRAPYFPTSTGAATAVVHDAPQAADAIASVLRGTASVESAAMSYSQSVRDANQGVIGKSRIQIGRDLGVAPDKLGPGTVVSVEPASEPAPVASPASP
jgi:2-polyprenyl-6-methoxyphenol hydroxylase-like FAD-dependent oxidoreductase